MLARSLVKEIILDQRSDLLKKPLGIPREICAKIQKKITLPHIIFITGLRRTGKSTLLRQIIHEYYHDEAFYYLNFEDERLLHFEASEFNQIYELLLELCGSQKTFFLDEIQNVPNFESFIRRFYDNGFKFYITGSSANLLQSDFATKLTGRYVTLFVKPFSFTEFLTSQKIPFDLSNHSLTEKRASIKKAFDEYFVFGGMPEFVFFRDSEILYRIYQDILYKDVQFRHGSVDMSNLRELAQYLVSNISKKFSYNKMKTMLRIKSVTTIRNYIEYIEETCFGLILRQYDRSVKMQLLHDKKFYVLDPGFIRKISTTGTADRTYAFENLILIALWSQDPLFYFQNVNECDFVVLHENIIQKIYQVCFELTPQNRPRELGGLIEAANSFHLKEGWLITYDQEEELLQEKVVIHIVPAWKWLILQTQS